MNGQVLTITLNRPDALNSIRPEMLDGMKLIVNTESDKNISVIVIEGSGRAFSAGVDLRFFKG